MPAAAQLGDYNLDNLVDTPDFTVWRDNLGSINSLPNRDPGNNGPIGAADYNVWKANFTGGSVAGVPPGAFTLSVTNLGPDANNNLQWSVRATPDVALFSNHPPQGIGGSMAEEIGFQVIGSSLVSAAANVTNFSFNNPGNNLFTGSVTNGVAIAGNDVFAALGSDFFTTGTSKEVLVIKTAGTGDTTIQWSGLLAQGGLANDTSGSASSHLVSMLLASGNWTDNVWSTPAFPNNGGGTTYDAIVTNHDNSNLPLTVTIPAVTNINISGLTLGGSDTIAVNGSLVVHAASNWTDGTLAGTGTIQLAGDTTISGPGSRILSANLTNSGTMAVQSGSITFSQSGATQAQLHNTGNISLNSTGTPFVFGSGSPTFVNEVGGTVTRLGVPGPAIIDVATINHGQIQVAASNLVFNRGLTVSGGGVVQLNNGSLASPTVTIDSGGQLTGTGSVSGTVSVGTTAGQQQATLSPGFSPGHLDIFGDYHQGSNGKMLMDVAGTSNGSFDTVGVTGNVTLGGALQLDATGLSSLAPGTSFQIITAGNLPVGQKFDSVHTVNHIVGTQHIFFAPVYGPASGAGAGAQGGSGSSGCGTGVCIDGFYEGDMNRNGVFDPMVAMNGSPEADVAAFVHALNSPFGYFSSYFIFGNESGDINDDGRLDFDDIKAFAMLMGQSGSGATAPQIEALIDAQLHNVPEPATCWLFLVGGCILLISSSILRRPIR
jgi:hypothetical protein